MLIREGQIYKYGNFGVAPILSEELLAFAYLRLQKEKLLTVYYHQRVPSLRGFIEDCLDGERITLGGFVDRGNGPELMGFGKSAAIIEMGGGYKKAELSEVFFREFWGNDRTLTVCQLMMEWLFEQTNIYSFFGTTPVPNKLGVRFMERLGFEHIDKPVQGFATWRGEPCAAYLSWMTRPQWEAITPFKEQEVAVVE